MGVKAFNKGEHCGEPELTPFEDNPLFIADMSRNSDEGKSAKYE